MYSINRCWRISNVYPLSVLPVHLEQSEWLIGHAVKTNEIFTQSWFKFILYESIIINRSIGSNSFSTFGTIVKTRWNNTVSKCSTINEYIQHKTVHGCPQNQRNSHKKKKKKTSDGYPIDKRKIICKNLLFSNLRVGFTVEQCQITIQCLRIMIYEYENHPFDKTGTSLNYLNINIKYKQLYTLFSKMYLI